MFGHHGNNDSHLEAAKADVRSLLGRLGHDISTLDDRNDPANRQALADASERYDTAGGQMSTASSLEEVAVARAAAIEGLHATRLVRTRTGLDPGPDPAEVPVAPPADTGAGSRGGSGGGGALTHGKLGSALGAGALGGLLGIAGGGLLGEILGGDEGGGGWGGDGGDGWGGDGGGGGDWGGDG